MKCDSWQTAAALCLMTACSSPGNTGRSGPSAELVAAVPWTNGAIPLRYADGALVIPLEPVYPPIGANRPDPGSGPIDCSTSSSIELSPFWVETFEAEPRIENSVGIAVAWSSYDDGTEGAFRVPGDASWYPGIGPERYDKTDTEKWGLAADRVSNGPSCDGLPNDWAFHFRGGRFNYFGAGAEHPLAVPYETINPTCPGTPVGSDFCPALAAPGAATDPVGLPADLTMFAAPAPHLYWDVSRYDGVTFWARRGPDGQPGMLFALQDKHTSDALNRENQTFCRRIKDCRFECQNGSACSLAISSENPTGTDGLSNPVYRCVDPVAKLPSIVEPALTEELYPLCGPSACRSPGTGLGPDLSKPGMPVLKIPYNPDRDFDDVLAGRTSLPPTECKVYEFSGSQAGMYCYAGEPPPPDEQRCSDGWTAPVRLSTDWKLYIIPFSEFRQVGFAKRAPFLDLHSINMMALQFPVGFADVYIDNVSFYRRRR